MQQPRQVVRGLLAAIGAGALVLGGAVAFRSIPGGAPEFRPQPSNGQWAHEEDFVSGPGDDNDDTPWFLSPLNDTPAVSGVR